MYTYNIYQQLLELQKFEIQKWKKINNDKNQNTIHILHICRPVGFENKNLRFQITPIPPRKKKTYIKKTTFVSNLRGKKYNN